MDRRDMADDIRRNRRYFIESEIENGFGQPATKMGVCPSCDGHGKYVNPAVDSRGLTSEDFAQDPDLYDNYISGVYDVRCEECNGNNVVETFANEEVNTRWHDWLCDMYDDRRTRMAESGIYY